jgi:hypothetical protein
LGRLNVRVTRRGAPWLTGAQPGAERVKIAALELVDASSARRCLPDQVGEPQAMIASFPAWEQNTAAATLRISRPRPDLETNTFMPHMFAGPHPVLASRVYGSPSNGFRLAL